jgi:UDP-N-acetylglucosamine 4-epimerase
VDNVVQANILAATAPRDDVAIGVFNIACGASTTLLELFDVIRRLVGASRPSALGSALSVELPRPGDIPHSLASIDRARGLLGYVPSYDVKQGLEQTVNWYLGQSPARFATNGTSAAFSSAQEAS